MFILPNDAPAAAVAAAGPVVTGVRVAVLYIVILLLPFMLFLFHDFSVIMVL